MANRFEMNFEDETKTVLEAAVIPPPCEALPPELRVKNEFVILAVHVVVTKTDVIVLKEN